MTADVLWASIPPGPPGPVSQHPGYGGARHRRPRPSGVESGEEDGRAVAHVVVGAPARSATATAPTSCTPGAVPACPAAGHDDVMRTAAAAPLSLLLPDVPTAVIHTGDIPKASARCIAPGAAQWMLRPAEVLVRRMPSVRRAGRRAPPGPRALPDRRGVNRVPRSRLDRHCRDTQIPTPPGGTAHHQQSSMHRARRSPIVAPPSPGPRQPPRQREPRVVRAPGAEAQLPADNGQRRSSLPGHPLPGFDDLRHSRAQHSTRPDRDGHRGIGARDDVLHPRRAAGARAGRLSHMTGVPTESAA